MVKKIKKYAKFIVCVALIMGLIAPSYAALSASDGSAFVTKAEFDSALADFNSRLTTFEAGINSKIDSQVTSYLDRNGIWNGNKVTLENQKFSTGGWPIVAGADNAMGNVLAKDTSWQWLDENAGTLNQYTNGAPKGSNYGGYGANGWYRWQNNKYNVLLQPVRFRCNKSGLFVGTVVTTGVHSEYGQQYELNSNQSGGNGLIYSLTMGSMWVKGDIPTAMTYVVDDTKFTTKKNVWICPSEGGENVLATYNNIVATYNWRFDGEGQKKIVCRQRQYVTMDSASLTESEGMVYPSGTFLSMFFVHKGDVVWTTRYAYPSLTSCVDNVLDRYQTAGLGLQLKSVTGVIY